MYIKNDETYPSEADCPEFGSIRVVRFRPQGECRYQFDDADRDKLSLLKNAGEGSLAYCVDKKYWLIKHNGEWCEV